MQNSNKEISHNIEKLRKNFPELFTENKVDIDKLCGILFDYIEKERYEFTWAGKKEAIQLAEKQATNKLHPCKEESVQWDTTENLFIEGDNLEVLRILQHSYKNKVKVIYIDPPYNTGKNFVYKDTFTSKKHPNAESSGRYHSAWLNMMYPRVKLAKKILREDGIMFISIDDHEQANLKKICDEIFGEENYIETFLWTKTNTPPSLATKSRKTVEYILCYEKSRNNHKYKAEALENGDAPLLNGGNPIRTLEFPRKVIKCKIPDGVYKRGLYEKVDLLNDLIVENGENKNKVKVTGEFKWTQEKLNEEIAKGTYFLIKSKMFSIRFQRPFDETKFKTPTNFITNKQMELDLNKFAGIGTNETASKELKQLDLANHFDYPKPVGLITYLLRATTDANDIIMDFFAGSATTAHAVMKLNSEDGGKRKFIMVQTDEEIAEDLAVYQKGFHTIAEISKERIRRAGQKVVEESKITDLDIGFRVYKLTRCAR